MLQPLPQRFLVLGGYRFVVLVLVVVVVLVTVPVPVPFSCMGITLRVLSIPVHPISNPVVSVVVHGSCRFFQLVHKHTFLPRSCFVILLALPPYHPLAIMLSCCQWDWRVDTQVNCTSRRGKSQAETLDFSRCRDRKSAMEGTGVLL